MEKMVKQILSFPLSSVVHNSFKYISRVAKKKHFGWNLFLKVGKSRTAEIGEASSMWTWDLWCHMSGASSDYKDLCLQACILVCWQGSFNFVSINVTE